MIFVCKEVVEWLRDHARRCEQYALDDKGYRGRESVASKKFEAQYAAQFADMIEQRFVISDDVAKLARAPSTFPPIPIYAPTGGRNQRPRRRRQG